MADTAIVRRLLIDRPSVRALVSTTLPPVVIASILLIAPMHVYSQEMTWDLLFNLDGAWRLYNGQIPHFDFHTELGALPFATTALGFYLLGPNPTGFLVGECVFAVLVLALSIAAVAERLPLVPATIFTILCTFISLMPLNYGDGFGAYSFAMPYNRFGWSISGILFVLLFIGPLDVQRSVWKDCFVGLAVLLLLYYDKITYFAIGMAALALALIVPGHVCTKRREWLAVFVVAALGAIAPFNLDYLRDIINSTSAGGARILFSRFVVASLVNDPAEHAVALACGLLLTATASREQFWSRVAGGWFLAATGLLLLSQNAQTHGIPSYAVISLLVYGAARDLIVRQAWGFNRRECCLLLAPLVFPLLLLVACGISLSHYCYTQVKKAGTLFVVAETNLKGLAVPLDDVRAFESFNRGAWSPDLFNRIRSVMPRYELSQLEYVRTIVDLSSLWRNTNSATDPPPRIMVVDRVNPLPFMLGLPSPRGVDLWWGEGWGQGLIRRSGDDVFADADFVATPRYPTIQRTTEVLMDYYRDYLEKHFRPWRETPEWVVLRRR